MCCGSHRSTSICASCGRPSTFESVGLTSMSSMRTFSIKLAMIAATFALMVSVLSACAPVAKADLEPWPGDSTIYSTGSKYKGSTFNYIISVEYAGEVCTLFVAAKDSYRGGVSSSLLGCK